MEFEGQYLTYENYRGLGGKLTIMPFNLLEFEIRKQIDKYTHGRLINIIDIPQEVKLCEMSLIKSIQGYADSINQVVEHNGVASTSTDGYSESYMTPAQIKEIIASKKEEVKQTIRDYLSETKVNGEYVLYAGGVYVNKQQINFIP